MRSLRYLISPGRPLLLNVLSKTFPKVEGLTVSLKCRMRFRAFAL